MTHFPVFVAVPPDAPPLKEYLDEILAPYDEGLEVAPYRELVTAERIAQAKEYYTGSTVDQDKYVSPEDFDPFKVWEDWSGRELHSDDAGYYELSTYNEQSRWDWYQVGGRWAGSLKRLDFFGSYPWTSKASIDKLDLDFLLTETLPTAMVDLQGAWHQRGKVGWWGTISDEVSDEEWTNEVKKIIDDLPSDTILVVVDCHI